MGLIATLANLPLTPAISGTPSASAAYRLWHSDIAAAAQRFDLPQSWIGAVLEAESGGDPHAVSPKGAMGLMQLMPQTWAALRARFRLGDDPFDPHDNVFAGAAYLRALYNRYGYPALFAAYNAGRERYDDYLFRHRPLPAETLTYLARLHQPMFDAHQAPSRSANDSLFFPLNTGLAGTQIPSTQPPSGGLFIPLATSQKQLDVQFFNAKKSPQMR